MNKQNNEEIIIEPTIQVKEDILKPKNIIDIKTILTCIILFLALIGISVKILITTEEKKEQENSTIQRIGYTAIESDRTIN